MQIQKTVVETLNMAPVSIIWGQNNLPDSEGFGQAHPSSSASCSTHSFSLRLRWSFWKSHSPLLIQYPEVCIAILPSTAACAGLSGLLCRDSNSLVQRQASAAPQNSLSRTSTFKTRATWASLMTLSNSTAGSPQSLTSLDQSCIQLCVLTERKHFPRQLFSRSREPSQFRLYSFKWIQRSSLQEMGSCLQDVIAIIPAQLRIISCKCCWPSHNHSHFLSSCLGLYQSKLSPTKQISPLSFSPASLWFSGHRQKEGSFSAKLSHELILAQVLTKTTWLAIRL